MVESRGSILIVEDDATVAGELQLALARLGYRVEETVTSAELAIGSATVNRPLLVLMDIHLGGGHGGVEVAATLRARFGVPVVFLITSVTDAATLAKAGATSPVGYVQKPFSGAILRATLDLAVQRITEQGQARPLLEFSNRMSTLGTLAVGIIQEIHTPLSFMAANVRYALDELPKNKARAAAEGEERLAFRRVEEALQEAEIGGHRIAQLVASLQSFARQPEAAPPSGPRQPSSPGLPSALTVLAAPTPPETPGAADLAGALRWALSITSFALRQRARLVVEISDLPPVQANEARLSQVFLNLLLNAAQAIPPGAPTEHQVRVVARVDRDGWVVAEVSDSGAGLSPDAMAHLFEPFFTTKQPGQGAGLGLAISQNIVSAVGGALTVTSEEGRGATFCVRLPVVPGPGRAASGSRLPRAGSQRRVLVIDDEPMILRLVRRVLADDHQVTTLDEAEKALTLLDSGARFDVIICDLMMPGMGGIDFHTILARTHPEQADRVVFISGGATNAKTADFLALFPGRQLEKPFNHAALKALIASSPRSEDPPGT